MVDQAARQEPGVATGMVVQIKTCWNYMDFRHRKSVLVIVGMAGDLKVKGVNYEHWPNANFYMDQGWEHIPPQWQKKIYDFMNQVEIIK